MNCSFPNSIVFHLFTSQLSTSKHSHKIVNEITDSDTLINLPLILDMMDGILNTKGMFHICAQYFSIESLWILCFIEKICEYQCVCKRPLIPVRKEAFKGETY